MTKIRSSWIAFGLLVAASVACGGPSTSSNAVEPPPVVVDPGTPPNVSVVEDPVDFGMADCGGSAPAPKSVKISNSGGGTVSWTAELEATGFNIVGATSGTFTGGGSVNVKVRASSIPATATAGTVSLATLIVVIDKAKIYRIPLRVTAQGATLSVMPGEAAFGEWPINSQAPDLPVTIKNTGNKDVSVSFAQPKLTDFGLNWTGSPAAVTVGAGATVPGAVARFRPSKLTLQSTSASMTVTGAVCGTSASAVTMNGKGTGGVVGISPGQLDFGKVNCGGKAGFQVFTILNSGNSPFTWTAALGLGAASSFDISPVSGTVLAGSQTNVFVTPKDIPQTSAITNNLYGDTLTVTTDAANDTPHPVPLLMGAKGAILAFTAMPADYGTQVLFSATTTKTATISNTGNAPATVSFSSSTAAYLPTPASGAVAAAGALDTSVGFAPRDFGDNNAALSVTTSDVVCQPLPAAASLTGKGKGFATSVALSTTNQSIGGNRTTMATTCAVLSPGGHVACWGSNQFGQLGNGTTTASLVPVVIPSFSGAAEVTGDGTFSCARMTDGTVYCWGDNHLGQLGVAGGDRSSPVLVAGLSKVLSLSASHHHVCAVTAAAAGDVSGKVYCWGYGRRYYELGNGVQSAYHVGTTVPVEVTGIPDATQISLSGGGGCARRADGTVSVWGAANSHGQRGNGTTTTTGAPTGLAGLVLNLTNATAVGCGHGQGTRAGGGCALQSTGAVACWGTNKYGQVLQPAGTIVQTTIVATAGVAGATALAVGRHHSCALVAGGGVKCWGAGALGQLGNNAVPVNSAAVDVVGLPVAGTTTTQIAAGGNARCAVLNTGALMCWGANDLGQLGNPAATGMTPSLVSGF